jgi:flavin reductase (DIM6/NTAB) family NADH-FMN oxidoreductase RutF
LYPKDAQPLLDEKAKRTLLRHIPHPLNICGVKDGEDINGFTLSWTTQASFSPPMIATGVRQDSRSHAMILASRVFAVSFLEKNQPDLAETFFKPQRGEGNKFGDIAYTLGEVTGCPILQDCLGYIECEVKGSLEEGDHTIFVGEVVSAGQYREGEPLWLKDTPWQYGG